MASDNEAKALNDNEALVENFFQIHGLPSLFSNSSWYHRLYKKGTTPQAVIKNEITLEEIILQAMENPKGKTATILKEKYQLDISIAPETPDEKGEPPLDTFPINLSDCNEDTEKQNEYHNLFKKVFITVCKVEKPVIRDFFTAHTKSRNNDRCYTASIWRFFRPKMEDEDTIEKMSKKSSLVKIIKHSNPPLWLRILAYLPPFAFLLFYTGDRSHRVVQSIFGLNTRDTENQDKSPAQVGAEIIQQRLLRGISN